MSSGLSAALQMAVRKGFIDTSKQKRDSSSVVHIYNDVHRDRYIHNAVCVWEHFNFIQYYRDYERQKERERER